MPDPDRPDRTASPHDAPPPPLAASDRRARAADIHPTAIVDDGARIGAGTRIWHWTHVCASARIGNDCSLGQNVFVGPNTRIGNNVRIQNNVSIYEGVELDDDVFCGPSMVFTNVINPRSHVPRKHTFRPTRVQRGASIGANATLVCGVTIGAYAMIGAGAVVSRDVPPHALVSGVPARRRGWICWCGEKLAGTGVVTCTHCARRYRVDETACTPLDPENSSLVPRSSET